jgi:hypothetical protein
MSAPAVGEVLPIKWEFIALICEAAAGSPVVELAQQAGWIQE